MEPRKGIKKSRPKPSASASGAGTSPSAKAFSLKQKVEELPNAPRLVGSIVEKGFSSTIVPSSVPQPSVLPFPVARHRSHGPHWSPVTMEQELEVDDEMDLNKDDMNYEPAASFANPIEKKERKGLDFSNWRDFLSHDDSAPPKINKKAAKSTPKPSKKEEKPTALLLPYGSTQEMKSVDSNSQYKFESVSLMEQIDSENTARLSEMSTDEIAEAHTEIMQKMNPSIIEMLKKRGKDKLRKEKDSKKGKNEEIKENGKDFGVFMGDSVLGNGSWKAWSERVERVRFYRFSLDGDFLAMDPSLMQQEGKYNPDDVAERDFLRMEGDPASIGYTITEAISLARSMVPAQRVLALQLLSSILNNALRNLKEGEVFSENCVDWQAVWAFALGPEPQLSLSLRMSLDDNNDSVVLACARAIHSVLCCNFNESYFDVSEKLHINKRDICTAPVFRSRPELDYGFLQGGFWKYNTKPSNLLALSHENENFEGQECKNTVRDDMVVSEQDFAAGLIRMGILPRICYLLELSPLPNLEEVLISILVALARHSPHSADAILRCPRLVQSVVKILINQQTTESYPSRIQAVRFLKVLSKQSKQTCSDLVKRAIFQQAMWHWYRDKNTLEKWINSTKELHTLGSQLMVDQLRFWRVCINYGLCISYFEHFFPFMCLFLSLPIFEKLIYENVLEEFTSVASESYLVVFALAERLPVLLSLDQLSKREGTLERESTWAWNYVVPIVDLAVKWLEPENIPLLSSLKDVKQISSLLRVISTILHMLSGILDKIAPEHTADKTIPLPWLPKFVPRLGLLISNCGPLMKNLIHLRQNRINNINNINTCLFSTSCIQGLVKLSLSIDRLIQKAKITSLPPSCEASTGPTVTDGEIFEDGIAKWARTDLATIFSILSTDILSEWRVFQSIEKFNRVGPAPGIGFGWGSPAGGFWSPKMISTQLDSILFLELLEIFPVLGEIRAEATPNPADLMKINALLAVCLTVGPANRVILEKAFNVLFQTHVMKYLGICVNHFVRNTEGLGLFDFDLNYFTEGHYLNFGNLLCSHFKARWLDKKIKSSGGKIENKKINSLETIQEEMELETTDDTACDLLTVEWAKQRLPVPLHWFLSPVCSRTGNSQNALQADLADVVRTGLFLLLGLESVSSYSNSPVSSVSLEWKLHSLSMSLHHTNMDIIGEEKGRGIFVILQEIYSQYLVREKALDFKREIHESYPTFIESFIEQFGAISYGDALYARQVAIYLHRTVEIDLRLSAWNTLSSTCVLELLPPLDKCIGGAYGYLHPVEDNEGILEAYAKSWISGGLDRAFVRESMAFTLAMHHLSSFLFLSSLSSEKQLTLRNKLAKSLLRSYSQKPHSEGMLKRLVQHGSDVSQDNINRDEIERRFEILRVTCDGNSSLLAQVQKIRSSFSLIN